MTWATLYRRYRDRSYYRANRNRRRAQRLASKYGACSEWRLWPEPLTHSGIAAKE